MLDASPEVDLIRTLVGKRLMDSRQIEVGPAGPRSHVADAAPRRIRAAGAGAARQGAKPPPEPPKLTVPAWNERFDAKPPAEPRSPAVSAGAGPAHGGIGQADALPRRQSALRACFSSSNWASPTAPSGFRRWRACWSCRGSVAPILRVPKQDQLPPGPLATGRLDVQLLQLGLATMEELVAAGRKRKTRGRGTSMTRIACGCWPWPTSCGGCSTTNCPGVRELRTQAVWAAGELLEYGGDFNKYIAGKDLQKQEGMIFRHLLRLILLVGEFQQLSRRRWTPLRGRPSWTTSPRG